MAVKEDISRYKRMEQELRGSINDFRLLFDNMLNGFSYHRMEYEADKPVDYTYLRVNHTFENLTGLKNVIGRKVSEVIPGILEVDPELFATYVETVRTGTPRRIETRVAAMDKWFAISVYRPAPGHFATVFDDITGTKQTERQLRESQSQLRALLASQNDAREDERTRVARELHDVLGQLLTGMSMDISWLERRVQRIADEELRNALSRKLSQTAELTGLMLVSVRKISRQLRSGLLTNLGLGAAIQHEARQFAQRTGIACEITTMDDVSTLPGDHAIHVFRIFQETLTNVARHSHATQVWVAMARDNGRLSLTVTDNGCGISEEALTGNGSLGLLGMSERAKMLGGSVEITGHPGEGTRVVLTIPCKPQQHRPGEEV